MLSVRKAAVVFFMGLLLILSATGLAASYNEAPMLEEMVKVGELPPVDERLPDEPLVVEPTDSVGKYGGTAHVAGTRPTAWGDDHMMMSLYATLVQPTPAVDDIVPHLARDFHISDDKTTFTFYLRKGVKWSDGHPFTTEDIRFWYEDVLHNEDLTPIIGEAWRAESATGQVVALNVIDDYTFQLIFASPKPFFVNRMIHNFAGSIIPKHYLKQFHVHYVPEEELKAMAVAEGFDEWYELYGNRATRVGTAPINPDLPTVGPYILESITSDRRTWVRNPYFWKVDTAGNQLPYIDRINCQIVSDREVLNGMIISGGLDFAAFESDIRDYPVFRRYEDEGNYRVILWKSALNEVTYQFNMTHTDPVLREIFGDKRFRQALSLAIDRDEINELIYHGQGKPSQLTVMPTSRFFKPEYATAYADHDPERANKLLDEMGLDRRDSDGYRLRSDGERLIFTLEYLDSETPKQPNVELVTQHWQEIGIDMRSKLVSSELQSERATANLMDATVWHGDSTTDILFPMRPSRLVPIQPSWEEVLWTEWARWFRTAGEQGEEPPAFAKELRGWWEEALQSVDSDKVDALYDNILKTQAENIFIIGTIAEAPYPLVVRKNLRNVPEDGYWAWDNLWITTTNPEQMFFD
ncbi:MAG: ABC transporter substrate-binding protein [Firmicutes bacterium]|nr:ABC transporter substrate-binding protein [Bacillota bacterium]